VSGARPGAESQLNESVDSQRLGTLEDRIEVATVKTDAARSAHEDCASCFEAFDSLPRAVCDTPGHSVAKRVRPLST
jgi:ArsR family metal-binding transcriptional regulator